ncbi:hypothetical protein BYT27DRAFT_7198196 [Phlegmacium glaucopus]|nr:hypothetical protein BYT27DRAFT_7198196 [Phlegmacium glaucopus]
MSNNHAHEGRKQEAPVNLFCSCRGEDCRCPSSSSSRSLSQHEPVGNFFNGHDRVLDQRRSINTHSDAEPVVFSRQPASTPIPSPHHHQTIRLPLTEAAAPPPTDITTSDTSTTKAAEPTSSVRTFRFKNSSAYGQNTNRRDTRSPSRRPSPSETEGSLKEINVTRRARRQIYLKPDVEGSPFRLLMYVDCRSVEPQQELG